MTQKIEPAPLVAKLEMLVTFSARSLAEGGILFLLVQPVAVIMVGIPALALGIAATSGKAFRQSWTLVFTGPTTVDRREAEEVCRYLRVCGATSIVMGGAAAILGFVITQSVLGGAPPPEVVGELLGASAIGMLYGLFFMIFCYVAEQRVKGKYLHSGVPKH